MNRKYTEEQIVNILKEAQAGMKAEELCRKYKGQVTHNLSRR